ncbi:MAG TPA: hypothetical protein VLT62_29770 [Candidatus Methylomirabilis sp.]|nr:hypothetical protein [Candidatus Methylomirabilis sp.]
MNWLGRIFRPVASFVTVCLAEGAAAEAGTIVIHCSEHLHYLMKLAPGAAVWIALPPEKLQLLEPLAPR